MLNLTAMLEAPRMLKFCWAGLMFSSILEWRLCTILISTVSSNKQQHRTKLLYVYIYIQIFNIYIIQIKVYTYIYIYWRLVRCRSFLWKMPLKVKTYLFCWTKKIIKTCLGPAFDPRLSMPDSPSVPFPLRIYDALNLGFREAFWGGVGP